MATNPRDDTQVHGGSGVERETTAVPTYEAIDTLTEAKHRLDENDGELEKKGVLEPEIRAVLPSYDIADDDSDHRIIVTGADAAAHLLPMRDDHDPSLTFRSIFLATILSAFQAVVYQIYQVCFLLSSPHGYIC